MPASSTPHSSRPVHTSRPFAGVALLALVALTLGACDLVATTVGARSWSMSVEGPVVERTVNVTDTSGKVVDVEFDPADADVFEAVSIPASQPDALDVSWTGGACDRLTDVTITPAGVGLAVAVAVTPDEEAVCDAFGEPRVIRLFLASPIAPAAVTVTQAAAGS